MRAGYVAINKCPSSDEPGLCGHGPRFASIINSDCKIVNYPGLVANLKAHMDRTVVLAWRVDLGLDLNPTTQRGGFDAFLFDSEVIPRDDCGFSIADP
jgi:hypothetical protein